MKIIFAQGNPDRKYAKTRHNTGFLVLDAFGDKHNALWKDNDKFNARMAELSIDGEKILLVKPASFYNDTGPVARKFIDFYKLNPADDLLVIHDDLSLPFGTIRIREKGSDAGNNGIKSLNTYVGPDYSRIRIGIWTEQRDQMDDVSFVLGNFSAHEAKRLEKDAMPKLIDIIEDFIASNVEHTSHKV
jgi:PTH1 family peptidyl-tRNA hydrolase